MSIMLFVKQMKSLLAVPVDKRDMDWAHRVCTTSRFVHINVWKFCAPGEYVRTEVIPLLNDARDQLMELVGKKGFDDGTLTAYAKNDEARISNLENNYLQRKPSDLKPDQKLSDQRGASI